MPEHAPAPEHPPAPEQTVRMEVRSSRKPPLTGGAPAAAPLEFDDTRPVSRDRTAVARAPEDEVPLAAAAAGTATAGSAVTDETADLGPLPGDTDAPQPPAGGPGGDGPAPVDGGGRGGRPWWRRPVALVPVATAALLAGAYGADLLLAGDTVPRHTVVDGVAVGGLSPAAAERALQRELAPRLAAARDVVAGLTRTTLSPADAGLRLDVPATVAAAARQPHDPWTRLTSLFGDRAVEPVLTSDPAALSAAVDDLATQVDRPAVEATVTLDGTTPGLVKPADGLALDRRGAAAAIRAAAARPGAAVHLDVVVSHPRVTEAAAQRVLDGTVRPALAAPVTVVSQDGRHKADLPPAAIAAALTFTPRDDGTLAVGLDPAKLEAGFGNGFAAFGTAARDATFKVSGNAVSVVPSVDGTGVDPAALARQLLPVLSAPAPRTVTAALGPVHAAFPTEQAQALGIKEQIGSFTTHFTSTPSGTNIRVVAEKVDGALVRPGETFSLNTFTGPRGTAQGYVPAGVIEGGEFTTAVGGGISQFATTMFNAAFFAGVQDVHHQPHSYWISRYPAGREATVFDGLIDLAWKNDSPTGIYVQTTWVPGSITVTFWGTKHYDIESVSGDRRNVVEPAVQEKADDGSCKPQAGQQGFDITVTRVFHELGTGKVLRRQDFHTHYKAEPVIHCVAPAPAGSAPPAPPA